MIADTLQNILIAVLVGFVIWLLSLIPYSIGWNWGHQAGQIDALNGKVYYRLEKQEDSEFRWVECVGVCEYEKKGD